MSRSLRMEEIRQIQSFLVITARVVCFDKGKMPWHSKYVVMDQGCGVRERGGSNHIKLISSIGSTVRVYNVWVYSSLGNLRLILTLIKITMIVITIPEEKIKSGL